jgi:hypothetical protein
MKKTNKKYYWKVVKFVSPEVYRSCVISKGKYSLEYRVGVPTKSLMKENGIFVFDTRESAIDFRRNEGGTIFKCEVEGNEIECPTFYAIRELKMGGRIGMDDSFPEGTKSFPSVTLIKKYE